MTNICMALKSIFLSTFILKRHCSSLQPEKWGFNDSSLGISNHVIIIVAGINKRKSVHMIFNIVTKEFQ